MKATRKRNKRTETELNLKIKFIDILHLPYIVVADDVL